MAKLVPGFNPCFDGFCSKTLFALFFASLPPPVSILVLMDFALKPTTQPLLEN